MNPYFDTLKAFIEKHPPSFGDSNSVLEMLYECYNEHTPFDTEQIKAGFHDLYQAMNGMALQDMDKITYPLCTLCRAHEKSGFMTALKIGFSLEGELSSPPGLAGGP